LENPPFGLMDFLGVEIADESFIDLLVLTAVVGVLMGDLIDYNET
jgi:hypothetical protein